MDARMRRSAMSVSTQRHGKRQSNKKSKRATKGENQSAYTHERRNRETRQRPAPAGSHKRGVSARLRRARRASVSPSPMCTRRRLRIHSVILPRAPATHLRPLSERRRRSGHEGGRRGGGAGLGWAWVYWGHSIETRRLAVGNLELLSSRP